MSEFLQIEADSSLPEEKISESYSFDAENRIYTFKPLCSDEKSENCFPFICKFLPGEYKFELFGARGSHEYGGRGGYAKGEIDIRKKEKFFLYIGTRNGFNGGGASTNGNINGGGATDVRISDVGDSDESKEQSLRSRIIVAGGGGGAAAWDVIGAGGCGGGINGLDGNIGENPSSHDYFKIYHSTGATQFNGGIADPKALTLGQNGTFGQGGKSANTIYAGGGGGGWYGGAGGSDGRSCVSSGSGGSSFISGHPDCYAIDSEGNTKQNSHHFSGYVFTNTYTESCKSDGDGEIKITLLTKYKILTCDFKLRFQIELYHFFFIFILS